LAFATSSCAVPTGIRYQVISSPTQKLNSPTAKSNHGRVKPLVSVVEADLTVNYVDKSAIDTLSPSSNVTCVIRRTLKSNAMLAGLPRSTTAQLQRVQNAKSCCASWSTYHVTSTLKDRHWLPVEQRIVFKLCLLMHHVHRGRAPSYLHNCVSASADITSPARKTRPSASEVSPSRLLSSGTHFHLTSAHRSTVADSSDLS